MQKRKHFISAQAALHVKVQDEPPPYRFVYIKVRRYMHMVVSQKLQFITVLPVKDLTTEYICKSIITVLRASKQVRYIDLKYYPSWIGAKVIHLYLIKEQLYKRRYLNTLLNIKAGCLTKLLQRFYVVSVTNTPLKSNRPHLSLLWIVEFRNFKWVNSQPRYSYSPY